MQKSQNKQKLVEPQKFKKSEAVFTAEILDSYPEYNLIAERILRNGNPANTQLIVKNGKVVSHFTERYHVLPNEEALIVAEEIKEKFGLIYAKDMPKSWKGPLEIPQYMGHLDKSITALLVDPTEVNLSAGTKYDDDWFRMGIGIGSSIDGSSSLKSFGYTFRQICKNYAFHKFHLGSLKVDADINPKAFNDAKILNKTIFVHSAQIDIVAFAESVANVLKQGKDIVRRYQQMHIEKLLDAQAQELIDRLPHTILKQMDWIKTEKKEGMTFTGGKNLTRYQAFNDITDALTHTEDLSYRVQMKGFNRLDSILVAPRAS